LSLLCFAADDGTAGDDGYTVIMPEEKARYSRLLFIDQRIASGGHPNAVDMAAEYEPPRISRRLSFVSRPPKPEPPARTAGPYGQRHHVTLTFLAAVSIDSQIFRMMLIVNHPLPLFDFSYVLIRDHVLRMDSEETALKYLNYVFDELRRVYGEIQAGTHGKSRYDDMEVPDHSHIFAPEEVRANFNAPGAHPMDRYFTVRMLRGLQRFLWDRLAKRDKYTFTPEEWLDLQAMLNVDESGQGRVPGDSGGDEESIPSEIVPEARDAKTPAFLNDETVVEAQCRRKVEKALRNAEEEGLLRVTDGFIDFPSDQFKSHAKFFLSLLNRHIAIPISKYVKAYVTVHEQKVEYERIAHRWPSDEFTKDKIRLYFY
jgi:hypothetical protein